MLQIVHDQTDIFYLSSRGAAAINSKVTFRCQINTINQVYTVKLFYCYGLDKMTDSYVQMQPLENAEDLVYAVDVVMPGEKALFYYWFEVVLADGRYFWGFPDAEYENLKAVTLDHSLSFNIAKLKPIPAFQITVYLPFKKLAANFAGAVMYQIFPDRFNRGKDFVREKMRNKLTAGQSLHVETSEEVKFQGENGEPYNPCDFYGGTLQGIAEKLDYLADMGVSAVYLNPVFKAFSNHRYDTADYLSIDPLLGDLKDFHKLMQKGDKHGISFILDGVFNHTGANSIYFNKYGNFGASGAYPAAQRLYAGEKTVTDRYLPWYKFEKTQESAKPGFTYKSWWDFPELPEVDKNNLDYRDFIFGENGVIAYWLRQGAAGFRLDVADELPDDFLRQIYLCSKRQGNDKFIMGEIWEEASNKISYGHRRDYVFGDTLDSYMNYDFRRDVVAFLQAKISADTLSLRLAKKLVLTPRPLHNLLFNMLSSHDAPRIASELGLKKIPESRDAQAKADLEASEVFPVSQKVLLAVALQVFFPGICSVYYGDEILQQGCKDPFNRRFFAWQQLKEPSIMKFHASYKALLRLRRSHKVLQTGECLVLGVKPDVLAVVRFSPQETGILFLNRSDHEVLIDCSVEFREKLRQAFAKTGNEFCQNGKLKSMYREMNGEMPRGDFVLPALSYKFIFI